jgi:hypothetical protein
MTKADFREACARYASEELRLAASHFGVVTLERLNATECADCIRYLQGRALVMARAHIEAKRRKG